MATAPLLMLIVAALPRADAAPAPMALETAVAERSAVVRCVRSLGSLDLENAADAPAPTRALASAAVSSKRPARETMVQALERPTRSPGMPPALAPRTEPGPARGPPATRM